MPVKQTTTSQFNPAGMSAYNQMTPQMQGVLSDYMQNPLQASYFNTQLQMSNKNIGQMGQSNMSTLLNNAKQFGGGTSNPWLASQMAMQGRGQSGQQAGAFNNLLMGAQQNRQWATSQAAGYKPLQTGQTQQMTGLGTWLPQLISGGLGLATGLAGLGGGGGNMSSPLASGGGAMNSPFLGAGFQPQASLPPPPATASQMPGYFPGMG